MNFHSLFPHHVCQQYNYAEEGGTIPMKPFAGALAAQLLKTADYEEEKERMRFKRSAKVQEVIELSLSEETASTLTLPSNSSVDETIEDKNKVYKTLSGKRVENCIPLQDFVDSNGAIHTLAKFPVIQTGIKQKKRSMVQSCTICNKETTMFCINCWFAFCYSENNHGHGRKCFQRHVPRRSSGRLADVIID